jgi:hypothetical protein
MRKSIVAGLSLLAVSALSATVVTLSISSTRAAATPRGCHTIEFIGVAGSGELKDPKINEQTDNMGVTVRDLWSRVSSAYSGSRTSLVSLGLVYPAVPVDFPTLATFYPDDYANSVQAGVNALQTELMVSAGRCPAEQFILAGYSQGAQVVNEALAGLNPEIVGRVRAKILFGDPRYNHLNSPEDQGRDGVLGRYDGILSVLRGPDPIDPADVEARSRSYCDWRDIVCQSLLTEPNVGPFVPWYWHTKYRDWATQAATDFITALEPPAICRINTVTWSRGQGITSTSDGVEITDTQFGLSARPKPGYRFVGFVAVADEYTTYPNTTVARLDQPSYLTQDNPYLNEQDVATAGLVYYVLARSVPATCGRHNGNLTFSIPIAEDRHIEMHGRLTYGSRPYQGAMIEWQWASPGQTPVAYSYDFGRLTDADGRWDDVEFGTVKPVLGAGTYDMRLAFPGDVNHRETLSNTLRVTVVTSGTG